MKWLTFLKVMVLAAFIFFTFSCGNTSAYPENNAPVEEKHEEEATQTAHLKPAQIVAIGLETGVFSPLKIAGYFTTNGTIDLPPQSIATVNAPEIGFVKEVGNYVVGNYVEKGAVLAILEHPLYIQKQQEYLEAIAKLTWLKQELDRQKTLSDANANALKSYQKAQADFKVMSARKKGLEQYLKYLGIDVERLQRGEISQTIFIKSPLSGYLMEVNANQGMLVQPETKLYTIVNNEHVHLELKVFEKDIAKIEKGQKVTFTIPSLGEQQFEAEVHQVGKAFDPDNKSVLAHCHITSRHPKFVRGLYAEAKIWLDEHTVNALPEDAVIREGGLEYVFVRENEAENGEGEIAFKRIQVRTGKKDGNFVEVKPIDSLLADAVIVTNGAYYLMAEMKKGEVRHDH